MAEEFHGGAKVMLIHAVCEKELPRRWQVTPYVRIEKHEPKGGYRTADQNMEPVRLEGWSIRVAEARALFWVSAHTRFFTEFILPFVIAAATLAVAVTR